jgi:HD superfamily phosphohydrolase
MVIHDPLYGTFELPDYLAELLYSPEFARLKRVSLLNSHSPSLASLGEVRRYSHTLGVIRLALLNSLLPLSKQEIRAFLASLIVHDAGTPAFAHLFEYVLSEEYGWNHEAAAEAVLLARHHPDGHLHQFFRGGTVKYRSLCQRNGIDFNLVMEFVSQKRHHSKLIFGSLDLDNLDNVARMAWHLQIPFDIKAIEELARNLSISPSGELALPRSQEAHLTVWQQIRSAAYNVLVFDGPTVAGQAVLARVIHHAITAGAISDLDWSYDDDELLRALEQSSTWARRALNNDYFRSQPKLCLIYKVERGYGTARYAGFSRSALVRRIEEFITTRAGPKARVYGHILFDRGTFSKELDFIDPDSGVAWSSGTRSASIVVYGFAGGKPRHMPDADEMGREFHEWMERAE